MIIGPPPKFHGTRDILDGGVDPIFDREPSSLCRSVTGTTVGRGRIIPLTGVDNAVMDNEERGGSSAGCKS